jgi:hypothetical protein
MSCWVVAVGEGRKKNESKIKNKEKKIFEVKCL